jgi:VWFA-related protein
MKRVVAGAVFVASVVSLSAGQTPPAPQSPQAPAQEPPPITFRVETNFVEVDAIVTDDNGNAVTDLTKDDFQIVEEKEPQTIAVFSRVNIPVTRAETTLLDGKPIPQDTATNARGFDGRIYVLLLDDIHTNAHRSPLVRRAATEFIQNNMGANDVAAVIHASGRTDAGQEFTSNKRLLVAAVDRFMGRKLRSATLERLDEYNRQRGLPSTDTESARPGRGIKDPLDFQRVYDARMSMNALENISTYLERVRGRRKSILFFSEGLDYDTLDVMGDVQRDASTVLSAMRDAMSAATRSNVAFYTIDPRGLTALGDEGIELTAPPEDPAYGIGTTSMQDELRRSQDSLRTLADETGGIAAVNTNDFKTAYQRIVRDNSLYYVLGYYPKNERRDGRFRRISVTVRRPNVKVFARKGYIASRPKGDRRATPATSGTSTELREVINAPLSQSGLTLNVTAAPFRGPGEKAMVALTTHIAGPAVAFTQKENVFLNKIELSVLALDQQARVQGGDRTELDLKLRPQTHQLVQITGMRSVQKLELPPGRYQLRVAARAAERGELGSVFYDLDVPDFAKEKFTMSGILLTSRAAPLTSTPRLDPEIKPLLPTPPTTSREFVPNDTLTAFVEVYDALQPKHGVDITSRVRSSEGKQVFRAAEERSSDELSGKRGGYGYLVNIPLADFAPGTYVLELEAKPRVGNAAAVGRALSFRVVKPSAPVQTEPASNPASHPFRELARGPMSNSEETRQVVIRTAAEWADLWSTLPTKQPVPTVDFVKEMLVGVFLGSRPTGGFSVRIVGARLDADTLVVEYSEEKPAPDAMVTQQLTSPFAVARILKHDGAVRFEQVQR